MIAAGARPLPFGGRPTKDFTGIAPSEKDSRGYLELLQGSTQYLLPLCLCPFRYRAESCALEPYVGIQVHGCSPQPLFIHYTSLPDTSRPLWLSVTWADVERKTDHQIIQVLSIPRSLCLLCYTVSFSPSLPQLCHVQCQTR